MTEPNRPIGVFDSGLGGLGACFELRRNMPEEDIIYFGDTGRVPYGNRSPETIRKYAAQCMRFLLSHNVRSVLVACGTVSSVALDGLREEFSLPIFGVIDGAAKKASEISQNRKIAVIGTEATVASGVFERKLRTLDPDVSVISRACPLFVPLVENGFIARNDPATVNIASRYLAPIKQSGADTLILGCTHFPIIADIISDILPDVMLVNPATEAVRELRLSEKPRNASDIWELLTDNDPMSSLEPTGNTAYYVSDRPDRFESVASMFIGNTPLGAIQVNIENF